MNDPTDCPNPSAADQILHGEQPAPGPADDATTTRVFAALHRSAEQDVNRVIALYEQWVKAGPPPLGTLMARWWDARLAELHDAILGQPAQDVGPTVREAPADSRDRAICRALLIHALRLLDQADREQP
jgi:hypothetical protein